MTRLEAKHLDTGDWYPLHLPMGVVVPVTFRFADPSKLTQREAPYSGAFQLPFSNENNQFFGHYYQANLTNATFDAGQPNTCRLLVDGEVIIEGSLQLRSISLVDNTYEVNVVSGAGDLFTRLGDTKLRDAIDNPDDYGYTASDSAVIDSWTSDITNGSVGNGVIRIPLLDTGNSPAGRFFADYGVEEGLFKAGYLLPSNMSPTMSVDHLLRKVLSHFGYTIDSVFMATTAWTNLVMTLASSSGGIPFRPYYGCKVGRLTDQVLYDYQSISPSYNAVNFNDEASAPFFDPDGLFSGGLFTAPIDIDAVFRISLLIDNSASISASNMTVSLMSGGSQVWSTSQGIPTNTTQTVFPFTWETTPISMTQGQNLTVVVSVSNINGTSLTLVASQYTYFQFVSYSSPFSANGLISPIDGIPDMTCAGFIRDLVQRFNLSLLQSQDPQVLRLEPLTDVIGTGKVLDWTAKVDVSKTYLLKPATSLRNKTIAFSDGVDKDAPNVYHQENYAFPMGEYKYISEDSFAQGAATNKAVFGSSMISLLPKYDWSGVDVNTILFPRLWANNSGTISPVKTKPKLLYWNGTQATGQQPIYIGDTTSSLYGCVSQQRDLPTTDQTPMTFWRHTWKQGSTSPLIGDLYGKGFVELYWSRYLEQIYNDDARVLECSVALSTIDVSGLSLGDKVFIKGTYYRVLEVSGYTVETASTPVRLQRLLDIDSVYLYPGLDCDLTQTGSNVDGTTNWVNAAGVSTPPTQTCCEANGLTFQANNCWWTFPSTDGGDNGDPVHPSGDDHTTPDDSQPSGVAPPPRSRGDVMLSGDTLAPNFIEARTEGPIGLNLPKRVGGTGQYTRNLYGIGACSVQKYTLHATTSSTTAVVAGYQGKSTSDIFVGDDTVAQFQVRAIGSVFAANIATTKSFGDTLFVNQSIVIRNIQGAISIVSDINDESSRDSGLSAPTLAMTQASAPKTGLNTLYDISITGNDDVQIAWAMDVQVTYLNVSGGGISEFGETTENNLLLQCENGEQIITEEG